MAAILDFWRPSWIDNGYFLTLYSTYANDYLYQFWCFYHKVDDRHVFFFFATIDCTIKDIALLVSVEGDDVGIVGLL